MIKLKNMENFNYQKICKNLLNGLPQRTADVIERRFGLKGGERETLEAIGETYGRTRERVRQIEEDGISKIRQKASDYKDVFECLKKNLVSCGGLKKEKDLLENLGGSKHQNHIYFLLTIGNNFERIPEDDKFYPIWAVKEADLSQAKKTAELTINKLESEKKTLSLEQLLKNQKIKKNVFLSYIDISKKIRKNPEGKYGLENWLEINPRGVKDKAYLVLREEEKPLHFTEIASQIEKLPFPCHGKVHIATVHNELIKDERFVLVGRGLYALKEWGYAPGMVKDVIVKVLREAEKSLTKKEILKKVLKQRFVKANTVALNLHNRNYFLRDEKGRYKIREA